MEWSMAKPDPETLAGLRQTLARMGGTPAAADGRISLGLPGLDAVLGGGLQRAALHEVYAPGPLDLVSAAAFALALAIRAIAGRPLLWVRQDGAEGALGRLYPPGLAELGLNPSTMLLVRAADAAGVLRVAAEAARCTALGATLIEPWGEARLLDLTASRRLSLMAEGSGVLTLLLRGALTEGRRPKPEQEPGQEEERREAAPISMAPASTARTRWLVRAAPSSPLPANAPGPPGFAVSLLRQRGGEAGRIWLMEWNRDRRSFQEPGSRPAVRTGPAPLSRSLVPLSADRPAAARTIGDAFTGNAFTDWRAAG
jgi:protein ImuA